MFVVKTGLLVLITILPTSAELVRKRYGGFHVETSDPIFEWTVVSPLFSGGKNRLL